MNSNGFLSNRASIFNNTRNLDISSIAVNKNLNFTGIDFATDDLNYTFLSDFFCSGFGNFLNTTKSCACDIGYFDIDCSISGLEYWGKGFTAFQVIFAIAFAILFLVNLWHFVDAIIDENRGFCTIVYRWWSCPKYTILINLLIGTLSRFLYIIIDPYRMKNNVNKVFDKVLYEMFFSSIVCIFLILLLVWFGLFTAFDIDRDREKELMVKKKEINFNWTETLSQAVNNPIKLIKKAVKKPSCLKHYGKFKMGVNYLILLVYPIQIFTSYLKAKKTLSSENSKYIYSISGGLCFVFILFFLYYIISLKYTLSTSYKSPELVTSLMKNANRRPNRKNANEITKKDIIVFLEGTKDNVVLNNITKYILDSDTNNNKEKKSQVSINEKYDIEDYSELDFEEEVMKIDLQNKENYDTHNLGLFNVYYNKFTKNTIKEDKRSSKNNSSVNNKSSKQRESLNFKKRKSKHSNRKTEKKNDDSNTNNNASIINQNSAPVVNSTNNYYNGNVNKLKSNNQENSEKKYTNKDTILTFKNNNDNILEEEKENSDDDMKEDIKLKKSRSKRKSFNSSIKSKGKKENKLNTNYNITNTQKGLLDDEKELNTEINYSIPINNNNNKNNSNKNFIFSKNKIETMSNASSQLDDNEFIRIDNNDKKSKKMNKRNIKKNNTIVHNNKRMLNSENTDINVKKNKRTTQFTNHPNVFQYNFDDKVNVKDNDDDKKINPNGNDPIANEELALIKRNDKTEKKENRLNQELYDEKEIERNNKIMSSKREFVLTSNDMRILDKVFWLSIVVLSISICVVTLGVNLDISRLRESEKVCIALIVLLHLSFFLFGFFVSLLFVAEINNTEYANLKIIGEIEVYLKEDKLKRSTLVFNNVGETVVYDRLKKFLNIKDLSNKNSNFSYI